MKKFSPMKTKLSVLSRLCGTCCVLVLATAPLAKAQTSTNQPAPSAGSFFNSLGSYFTSFNTNNTQAFGVNKFKLWTGAESIQGGVVPLVNVVGLSCDVYKPTNSTVSLALENEEFNSGVAGTAIGDEIGGGINFNVVDTELTVFAHGGYNFTKVKGQSAYDGAIGLRILKALTPNTYAGAEFSVIIPQNEQRIGALAGFSF